MTKNLGLTIGLSFGAALFLLIVINKIIIIIYHN